jgi:hypothetical protein
MLAVVYLTLTAKPLSLRRLLILFIVALTVANIVLAACQVKHRPHAALIAATAVTLLVWSIPLARFAYYAMRFRVLVLDVLLPVSGLVRWTYGLALMAVPTLGIVVLLAPNHRLDLAVLPRVMAVAGLAGFMLQSGFDCWNVRRRPSGIVDNLRLTPPSKRGRFYDFDRRNRDGRCSHGFLSSSALSATFCKCRCFSRRNLPSGMSGSPRTSR